MNVFISRLAKFIVWNISMLFWVMFTHSHFLNAIINKVAILSMKKILLCYLIKRFRTNKKFFVHIFSIIFFIFRSTGHKQLYFAAIAEYFSVKINDYSWACHWSMIFFFHEKAFLSQPLLAFSASLILSAGNHISYSILSVNNYSPCPTDVLHRRHSTGFDRLSFFLSSFLLWA